MDTSTSATNPTSHGNTSTASIKKLARYGIVAIIIIVIVAMALLAFKSGFGFPSESEVSSALNAQFTSHPIMKISSSNASLAAEFSSFGIIGAEVENYTSSKGILMIGELEFKTASNATGVFSLMSSSVNSSLIQTYGGAKYILSPIGVIGCYKNFEFLIEYRPAYNTSVNTSAMNTLAKYTISAI
ncbi:MAG: hypothetical protein ACP5SA_03050 [Candidatus Micrarchaeia archaeon]